MNQIRKIKADLGRPQPEYYGKLRGMLQFWGIYFDVNDTETFKKGLKKVRRSCL